MEQLFGILGEMAESDRHALMRCALRAKHLRFLRNTQKNGQDEEPKRGIVMHPAEPMHKNLPLTDESTRRVAEPQSAEPVASQQLPNAADVLGATNIIHDADPKTVAEAVERPQVSEEDPPMETQNSFAQEISDDFKIWVLPVSAGKQEGAKPFQLVQNR